MLQLLRLARARASRQWHHGQDTHATAGEDGVLVIVLSGTLRYPPLPFIPPATWYPPQTVALDEMPISDPLCKKNARNSIRCDYT